jgi:NADH-quinone oxidoreductase subunit L
LVTAGAVVIIIYREILGIPTLILILLMIGAFTILIGRVLSLMERRIKKLVAFSTISQMGLAFVVFGLGNFNVGIINLVSHGLAKSLLFIQVGYYLHTISLQQNTRL